MKKILSSFIALLMVFSLNISSVMAEPADAVQPDKPVYEMIIETNVKQISAEDNYVYNDGSYLVNKSSLVGTRLEGKNILVTENGIYADGKILETIAIIVGTKFVADFIDGVLIYATGYSGPKLASVAIKAIVSLASAHPVGFFALMALATFTAAVVMSYETSTGNECILSPSGGYTCKYSLK